MITQEILKKLLHYDPDSGYFTWRARGHSNVDKRWAGKRAGGIKDRGDGYKYRSVKLMYRTYRESSLAYLYMTGEWPEMIDHLNRDATDNRWSNLVKSNPRLNSKNMSKSIRNKSGHTGVSWYPKTSKWRAHIMVDGKFYSLGLHDTIEDAIKAREDARIKFGFTEGHGQNRPGGNFEV